MSKFIIVENHYQGAGVVTGVVATTKNTFDSTVSLVENVLNNNDITMMLNKRGVHAVTDLILHEVFMIDYSKLDLGKDNYHRNAAARNWTDADIFALDSMNEVYNLAGDDDNFMIINLSKAASTYDVRSIELDFHKTMQPNLV